MELTVLKLLSLGIAFHIVYVFSIFDIYFRSPLVHGMNPVEPPGPAPAKRLLLAVGMIISYKADGLRADKLFEGRLQRAPFLKGKVLSEGRWGVSHTRVPTESRPGHVALIAGFYEDVSSVTKGWKTNAVEFDSFFNQSSHTWSFGSPDILPMFQLGASDPFKIETVMYEAKFEDFAKDDASQLDTWVFDKFRDLFENAKTNSTLNDMLHQDKIVFFLHLLGLDTNGHGSRPYSAAYLENIQVVDKGLEEVEKMMNSFYENDRKTAFIMTADHGMSNRGSHGDGDPQNTETPLIAWGAGIQTAKNLTNPEENEQSKLWSLNNLERNDVNQADIAPLMSSLIGVPFPMNSEGSLPINFLENTPNYKARAVLQNALAILAQYEMKANRKQRTEVIFFQPFEPLKDTQVLINDIKLLIEQDEFVLAEEKSFALINMAIEGLRYYQTYDWLLLRTIVSLGYSGWILYSSILIIKMYSEGKIPIKTFGGTRTKFAIVSIFSLISTVFYLKESPLSYYGYIFFPVVFWCKIIEDSAHLKKKLTTGSDFKTFKHLLVYAGTLEMLVVSYFYRELLTGCLLVMGFLWPLTLDKMFCDRHVLLLRAWRGLCLITSVFTLLSVELEESLMMIICGGILICISAAVSLIVMPRYILAALPSNAPKKYETDFKIVWFQISIILLSLVVVADTSRSLAAKEGLPTINAAISWLIMGIFSLMLASCILTLIYDRYSKSYHYLRRLIIIYLAFAPVFILLSVSFETLFYVFYSLLIFNWLLLEQQLFFFSLKDFNGKTYIDDISPTKSRERPLRSEDMRIASFFLIFINIAFFGTGNMASIASFTTESVYRFTTIFDPFLMGALLLVKILIPFFLLSSVLSLLSKCLELKPFSLFLVVLSTTDIMTLNFFFLVRDSGSWLEIGTSISHFSIASCFIVFQILLFTISYFLVGGVLIPQKIPNKLK